MSHVNEMRRLIMFHSELVLCVCYFLTRDTMRTLSNGRHINNNNNNMRLIRVCLSSIGFNELFYALEFLANADHLANIMPCTSIASITIRSFYVACCRNAFDSVNVSHAAISENVSRHPNESRTAEQACKT